MPGILFNSLKAVKEAESKAQDMIKHAQDEVESILKKAEADSIKTYDVTIENILSEAGKQAEKFKMEARENAQREADIHLKRRVEDIETLRARVEKNYEKSVQLVLQELFSIMG